MISDTIQEIEDEKVGVINDIVKDMEEYGEIDDAD